MEQDIRYNRMSLAFQHRQLGMQGYAKTDKFFYERWLHDFHPAEQAQVPLFQRVQMANRINVSIMMQPMPDEEWTTPIDARPCITEVTQKNIRDVFPFKRLKRDPQGVLLTEASMEDVLEYALAKQEPNQQRIRTRMINEKYKQATNVAAELRVAV